MKLLNTNVSRSLWYFATEDLNPKGLDLIPVLAAVQARYRFRVYPTKPEDIHPAPNGIQYGKGAFRLDDREQIEIVRFTIYKDGVVADTRYSTEVTDQFLSDVLGYVSSHGLTYESSMITKKAYVSELVVSSDLNIDLISPAFPQIASLVAQENGEGRNFFATSIQFGTDPHEGSPLRFSFERRADSGFKENRYFSTAPLTTNKHLEVLRALEILLKQ
jgi:hypothetical protein